MNRGNYFASNIDLINRVITLVRFLDDYPKSFIPNGAEIPIDIIASFSYRDGSVLHIRSGNSNSPVFIEDVLQNTILKQKINDDINLVYEVVTLLIRKSQYIRSYNQNIIDIINPLHQRQNAIFCYH